MFLFSKIWSAVMAIFFWGISSATAGEYGLFNTKDLHERVRNLRNAVPINEKEFALLADEVAYRIGASWYVRDETLRNLLHCAMFLDHNDARTAAMNAGKEEKDWDAFLEYRRFNALADRFLPLLEDRASVEIDIWRQKAINFRSLGNYREAAAAAEVAAKKAFRLKAEVDQEWLEAEIDWAENAMTIGQNEVADLLFGRAANYNYAILRSLPDHRRRALELVQQAASGWVRSRSGDARKLRNLFVAPAIQAVIADELKSAIEWAEYEAERREAFAAGLPLAPDLTEEEMRGAVFAEEPNTPSEPSRPLAPGLSPPTYFKRFPAPAKTPAPAPSSP